MVDYSHITGPSAILFRKYNYNSKILGVGFMQSKKIFIDSIWGPIDFREQQNVKNLYGGFIGLLLELGVIGIILYSFTIYFYLKESNYSLVSYSVIIYSLSFFYLTIFPFIMFIIALSLYNNNIIDRSNN